MTTKRAASPTRLTREDLARQVKRLVHQRNTLMAWLLATVEAIENSKDLKTAKRDAPIVKAHQAVAFNARKVLSKLATA